jgi:hypothetical protein
MIPACTDAALGFGDDALAITARNMELKYLGREWCGLPRAKGRWLLNVLQSEKTSL